MDCIGKNKEVKIFCLDCQALTPALNAECSFDKKNYCMISGDCSLCGKRMSKFAKKNAFTAIFDPNEENMVPNFEELTTGRSKKKEVKKEKLPKESKSDVSQVGDLEITKREKPSIGRSKNRKKSLGRSKVGKLPRSLGRSVGRAKQRKASMEKPKLKKSLKRSKSSKLSFALSGTSVTEENPLGDSINCDNLKKKNCKTPKAILKYGLSNTENDEREVVKRTEKTTHKGSREKSRSRKRRYRNDSGEEAMEEIYPKSLYRSPCKTLKLNKKSNSSSQPGSSSRRRKKMSRK